VTSLTRAQLESFRGAELPDLIGPGVRLVFVGINPGPVTAARQIHFGNPANRFRFGPALIAAGLVDEHRKPAPRTIDHNTTLTAAWAGVRRPVANCSYGSLGSPRRGTKAPGSPRAPRFALVGSPVSSVPGRRSELGRGAAVPRIRRLSQAAQLRLTRTAACAFD
jgi:hypothetical protein